MTVLLLLTALAHAAEPVVADVMFVDLLPTCGDAACAEVSPGDTCEDADCAGAPAFATRAEGPYGLRKALTRLATRMRVRLLDDLALQWGDATSPARLELGKPYKVTDLPAADELWEGEQALLREGTFPTYTVGGPALDPAERYPLVRWRAPDGTPSAEQPATAVVAGRFAVRLAADGSPVDAQLMRGSRSASAPFFEEMTPLSSPVRAGIGLLSEFSAPTPDWWWDCAARAEEPPREPDEVRPLPTRASNVDAACVRLLASRHARRFAERLSMELLRFTQPGHTPTHLRVLGALSAIETPPPAILEPPAVVLDDLVVASRGQLDPADRKAPPALPSAEGFHVAVDAIPRAVAKAELERLTAPPDRAYGRPAGPVPPADLYAAVTSRRAILFGDLVREDCRRPAASEPPDSRRCTLDGLDDASVAAWIGGYAVAGREAVLSEIFHPRVLGLALDPTLLHADLDVEERRVVLAHLRYALQAARSPEKPAAPAAVAKTTASLIVEVLGAHGLVVPPLDEQGPMEVDPTAICTVGDGPDALKEPVVGKVTVDLLFDAPAGTAPEDAFWQARDRLPFLYMDDPGLSVNGRAVGVPTVEELLVLPGGTALYRARQEVWSGWHLLWSLRPPDAAPADVHPLRLHTAAFCADTVLAPRALVPELLRAALLEPGVPYPLLGSTAPDDDQAGWLRDTLLAPLRRDLAPKTARVLVVTDVHRTTLRRPLQDELLPPHPYLVERERHGDGWLQAVGAAWILPADPTLPPTRIGPQRSRVTPTLPEDAPPELVAEVAKIPPRWEREQPVRVWTELSVALTRPSFFLDGAFSTDLTDENGTLPGTLAGISTVIGLGDTPRVALDLGAAAGAWARGSSESPEASASGEAWVGLRGEPLPRLVRDDPPAWGTEGLVARYAWGARLGAAYDSTGDTSVWLEPWIAWAIHRPMGPRAALEPHAPGLTLGPALRVQALNSDGSWSPGAALALRLAFLPGAK